MSTMYGSGLHEITARRSWEKERNERKEERKVKKEKERNLDKRFHVSVLG